MAGLTASSDPVSDAPLAAAARPTSRLISFQSALAGQPAHAALSGLAVAIPVLLLYLATLLPDVGFWDTAEFQTVGPVLGIAHPTGYPAYTLLAWLASIVFQPLGNEAFRANFLSAVLGAGGAGLMAATVTVLTRRSLLGIAAGASLAVSTEVWRISLHADPHALHFVLAALILLLLAVWSERALSGQPADRWLLAAAIAFGVALANHGLTFLLAPPLGLFVLLVQPGLLRRLRFVFGCAAALGLTTVALYLYLPIRSAMNPPLDYANPETWEGFRRLVFAEDFRGAFGALPDPFAAMRLMAGESFGELGALAVLAVIGVIAAAARRGALVVLLVGWFATTWLFALGYANADIGRYYIVPLMSLAVLGGLGAGALWDAVETFRPLDRAGRALLAVAAALILIGPLPISIAGRYGQVDESSDRLARAWLRGVMDALPPDAVVVSWWSYSTTLWYGQHVEGLRPDVTVINDSTHDTFQVIDGYLGQRPVYLIRLRSDLPTFAERYELSPVRGIVGGEIYRVEGRRAWRASALI